LLFLTSIADNIVYELDTDVFESTWCASGIKGMEEIDEERLQITYFKKNLSLSRY